MGQRHRHVPAQSAVSDRADRRRFCGGRSCPQIVREGVQEAGGLLPALPPGISQGATEETRHNKATFDFIVQNNLYKISGLKAAFGKNLQFPIDSIEVKANWVPVSEIPAFTNNKVTVAQVPQLYHVNSAGGVQYALVAMHVISKLVPNWTWATFEHRFNPGRCDIIGCRDAFGAHAGVRALEPRPPTRAMPIAPRRRR